MRNNDQVQPKENELKSGGKANAAIVKKKQALRTEKEAGDSKEKSDENAGDPRRVARRSKEKAAGSILEER